MNLLQFKTALNSLKNEIENIYNKEGDGERTVITDGALNIELYFNANPKILWLMKEAYDKNGGGWDFSEHLICDDNAFNNLVFGRPGQTWKKIAYIAFCVNNNYPKYESIDYLHNNRSMIEFIKTMSWVNLQKLPSSTGTRTNNKLVRESFERNHEIISKQIALLDPKIIICGGTFEIINSIWEFDSLKRKNDLNYVIKNKILYIDSYHPSSIKAEEDIEKYIDAVVTLIKEFNENGVIV